MSRLRDVFAALFTLAARGSLFLLGAVVAIIVTPAREAIPDPAASRATMDRVGLSDDRGQLRARFAVPTGEASTSVVIETTGGRELATVHVWADGALSLEPVRTGPIDFVLIRAHDGSIRLGVYNNPRVCQRLEARVDGTSEFSVCSAADASVMRVLRVGPDGAF